jgi:hypothetical protein
MINIFNKQETDAVIARINKLTPDSKPLWGKMSVDQMLAHCNVSYELAYENMHPKPNALMKLFMKLVAKQMVVNETPYKKNLRTAPVFIIADHKNFEAERKRLIAYIKKTQELGADHFDGRESHSFGKLTKSEWNNMFAKHLDHHLTQFGV